MIRRTRQDWREGATVKAGFMTLRVVRCIPTPNDGRPDKYELKDQRGRRYEFTPYYGLQRLR